MSYIWKNYDKNGKFVIDKYYFSPFLEVGLPYKLKDVDYIGANPIIRFYNIFEPWLSEKDWLIDERYLSENDAEALENAALHFLALLDRKCGVHTYSCVEFALHKSLLSGKYGKDVAKIYNHICSSDNQTSDMVCKVIVKWLRKHDEAKGRLLFFKDAVNEIFPDSLFYYNNQDQRYITYIPKVKNEFDETVVELLELLFMEATANTYVIWNKHFGIIDNKQTMVIGNMSIY